MKKKEPGNVSLQHGRSQRNPLRVILSGLELYILIFWFAISYLVPYVHLGRFSIKFSQSIQYTINMPITTISGCSTMGQQFCSEPIYKLGFCIQKKLCVHATRDGKKNIMDNGQTRIEIMMFETNMQ